MDEHVEHTRGATQQHTTIRVPHGHDRVIVHCLQNSGTTLPHFPLPIHPPTTHQARGQVVYKLSTSTRTRSTKAEKAEQGSTCEHIEHVIVSIAQIRDSGRLAERWDVAMWRWLMALSSWLLALSPLSSLRLVGRRAAGQQERAAGAAGGGGPAYVHVRAWCVRRVAYV